MTRTDDAVDPSLINLPLLWRRIDRWIVLINEILSCVIGITFTVLISLQVVSRYIFNFSIFAINSAAVILLVWFFMLGAGLALRHRAHVGFELLISYLPRPLSRIMFAVGEGLVLLFFSAMVWGGILALGSAARQVDSALGISLFWAMLAIPVGFSLLIYNQFALLVAGARGPLPKDARQ